MLRLDKNEIRTCASLIQRSLYSQLIKKLLGVWLAYSAVFSSLQLHIIV